MEKTTKNLVLFGILAVGGILAYKFIGGKKAGRMGGGDTGGGDNTGGGNTGGGNTGGGSTGGGFSQADLLRFKAIANDMFEAMDGCATNNDALSAAVSKINNELEWQAVIQAYGTRTTYCPWYCLCADYTGGLLGAIADEGNKEEINAILTAKGIKSLIP